MQQQEKFTLKVGDVLYQKNSSGKVCAKIVIDRITAKRAYSGNTEFDIEQRHDWAVYPRGRDKWGMTSYTIQTPILDKLCQKQKQLNPR
jgi:hypothetical protein